MATARSLWEYRAYVQSHDSDDETAVLLADVCVQIRDRLRERRGVLREIGWSEKATC